MTAQRWTCLDDELLKNSSRVNYVSADGTEYYTSISTTDTSLEKRLQTLVEIGLAINSSKNIPPVYYLEKDWDKKLKSIGRYNSFLNARSNLLFTTPGELEQYTPELGKIEGVVSKIYLMDDEKVWTNALVMENPKTKKAYYIPLRYAPSTSLLNKLISVECTKKQSGKLSPLIKVIDRSKITIKISKKKTTSYEAEKNYK